MKTYYTMYFGRNRDKLSAMQFMLKAGTGGFPNIRCNTCEVANGPRNGSDIAGIAMLKALAFDEGWHLYQDYAYVIVKIVEIDGNDAISLIDTSIN